MTFIFVLLVVVALLCLLIASRPSHARIERSADIAAPASMIFPHINNPNLFNNWNPWAKMDPDAKYVLSGPAEGVDSAIRWDGNSTVGSGIMTCIESKPSECVKYRMDFLKPMQNTQTAEFTLVENGNVTRVTWAMYGECDFMGKAVGLIMNCDKMVGEQFEKGLENLRGVVVSKAL